MHHQVVAKEWAFRTTVVLLLNYLKCDRIIAVITLIAYISTLKCFKVQFPHKAFTVEALFYKHVLTSNYFQLI